MKTKAETCETCGIVAGGAILHERISDYRGHRLCSDCQRFWKELEAKYHRKMDYDHFKAWGNKKPPAAPYPTKIVIPDGMTLCRQCKGVGCKTCGGKGYYQKKKRKART